MPKRQKAESQMEPIEQFIREAQNLIDASELRPTEAEAVFDRLVTQNRPSATSR